MEVYWLGERCIAQKKYDGDGSMDSMEERMPV